MDPRESKVAVINAYEFALLREGGGILLLYVFI